MKTDTRVALLFGIVGSVLVASVSFAQVAPQPPAPDLYGSGTLRGRLADRVLRDFDLNKDGEVQTGEAAKAMAVRFSHASGGASFMTSGQLASTHEPMLRAYASREFKRLDWNGDGNLSLDEYRGPLRVRFMKLDRGASGAISCKRSNKHGRSANGRYRGRLARFCAEGDLNRDGAVTRSEFDKAVVARYDQATKGAKGLRPDAFYGLERIDFEKMESRRFKRLDKNKDGKLSKAEFAVPGLRLFTRLDKNQDGILTKDELSGARHGRHRHTGKRSRQP